MSIHDHPASIETRRSRYTGLAKLRTRSSQSPCQAAHCCLRPVLDQVPSLTLDNSKEFARHQVLSHKLQADIYFADTYVAWQRGTNENTNGLIRQYLPKD